MFEKEAEEWVKENMDCCKTDNFVNQSIPYFSAEERCIAKSAFKDGAEFGYNKANEWHYVRDGDLPKNNTQVLALLENKRLKIAIFMKDKFTIWNKDCDVYTKLYNVIKWKEIVLPKESE